MSSVVPFVRIGHVLALPVDVGADHPSTFLLDTGIGAPVLDRGLADRLGVRPDGRTQRGRRMSGQEIVVPLATLPALRLGEHRWTEVDVGLFDLRSFLPPGLAHVEGFLSLGLFEDRPVRIDYRAGSVTVDAPVPDGEGRYGGVPLFLEREGASLTAQADLGLPDGSTARVEVDLGSDRLILHDRYMAALGFDADAPATRTEHGTDETGHTFTRRFGSLSGTIALGRATQRDPEVMFQEVIYDGLVGDQFLRRYDLTFDLPRSRMVLRPPGP